MLRSGILVALIAAAAVLTVSPAGAADTHVARILAQRAASNAALANRDFETFQGIIDGAYQITLGNGGFEDSATSAEMVSRMMVADTYVTYVRTPGSVDVGASAERAFESGTWVGTGTTPRGEIRIGGRYAAYWRLRDGEWRIHSELFVTLHCDGQGCPGS